jgi:putative ATP-dependent endonuclease of OLD family
VSRRGDAFDDYDHHLGSDKAQIGDAGETAVLLHFSERKPDEWDAEVVQTLAEAVVLDGEIRKIVLRLRSAKDPVTREMGPVWEFLDAAGNPLRSKKPVASVLRELQQLKPFFYLPAVRDAAREFQPRSAFWGPFLRDPDIAEDVRNQIEEDLNALNLKVIAADARLKDVRDRLQKAGDIVSIRTNNPVTIEAVPGRARDLLSRAQVAVSGRTGAKLPIGRHGAGTQSLSVLLLFESFLISMLEKLYGRYSLPVVAIEEPEAHLHPAAARCLWTTLSGMPGQKIVATHSGDVLARVPLTNVRRFCHDGNGISVRRLDPKTLDKDDSRKIALHVKATRGELLFARTWLLVEGATEIWLFEGIADILSVDLEREGIRIVQYAQVMPDPFVRLANDLGITWFCLADGDQDGQKYKKAVVALLNGRVEADHVLALPDPTIEVHLCRHGFGSVYSSHIAEQKRSSITSEPDDPNYWEQVVNALPSRGKEARVIEVIDEMRKRGSTSVPPTLLNVLDAAIHLAGGRRGP